MARRIFLLLAAFALLAPATPVRAAKAVDAKLIPKAEAALERIGVMTAEFTFQHGGQMDKGRLFVDRAGGRLRMEFDPPAGHLLIANGHRVDFLGGNGTVVNAGVQSTPLALIFGRKAELSGDVSVLETAVKGGLAYVVVTQRDSPEDGKAILHFIREKPTWRLLGWGFIDGDGRYTRTSISRMRHDVDLDAALFVAPNRTD